MPFEYQPWTYETIATRRARELAAHQALIDTAAPAILAPGSLEAVKAQQAVADMARPDARTATPSWMSDIGSSIRSSLAGPGDDDPIGKVLDAGGHVLRDLTSGSALADDIGGLVGAPGIGTRARKAIERIPIVGGPLATAADIATSPAALLTAGYGGAAAGALRGAGIVGKIAATAVEPLVEGGFAANVGAQAAAGAGATAAQEAVHHIVPEDAPMPVKIGADVAAMLAGGAAGVGGFRKVGRIAGEVMHPQVAEAGVFNHSPEDFATFAERTAGEHRRDVRALSEQQMDTMSLHLGRLVDAAVADPSKVGALDEELGIYQDVALPVLQKMRAELPAVPPSYAEGEAKLLDQKIAALGGGATTAAPNAYNDLTLARQELDDVTAGYQHMRQAAVDRNNLDDAAFAAKYPDLSDTSAEVLTANARDARYDVQTALENVQRLNPAIPDVAPGTPPNAGGSPPIGGGAQWASSYDFTTPERLTPDQASLLAPRGIGTSASGRAAIARAASSHETVGNLALKAFDQAAEVVRQDRQGVVGQYLDRVPGLAALRNVATPGRTLKDNVLETWVASNSAASEFRQMAYSAEEPLLRRIDQTFGEGVAAGGASPSVRFLGTPEQAALKDAAGKPITGTFADIAENPSLYDLTDEERAVIALKNQSDDELRQVANDGYGTQIEKAQVADGGAYVRRRDVSEAAQAALDAGGSQRGVTGAGKSKARTYDTIRERLAADPRFEPDLDMRRLVRDQHEESASAIEAVMLRAGMGGMTYPEAMAVAHPALARSWDVLHKQLQGLRATAGRLDERLYATVNRYLDDPSIQRTMGEPAPAAATDVNTIRSGEINTARLPELESLQAEIDRMRGTLTRNAAGDVLRNKANDTAMRSIGELEALADIRGAVDQSNGDVFAAFDLIDQQNQGLGRAVQVRDDTGLRAALQAKRRGDNRRARLSMTGDVDRYGDVIQGAEGGDDIYQIAQRRSEVLNDFVQEAAFDVDVQDAVSTYFESGMSPEDLDTLRKALDVRVGQSATGATGRNYGMTRDQVLEQARLAKAEIAKIAPMRKGAQLRDPATGEMFVPVQDGIYRYFPASDAKQINNLLKTSNNGLVKAAAQINATVLSGDVSPWTNQGMLSFLADPVATAKQVYSGIRAGHDTGDWLAPLRPEALVSAIQSDPSGWAHFAADIGHPIRFGNGTPEEFAGGLLGMLPKLAEKAGVAPGGALARGAETVSGKFNQLNEMLYSGLMQRAKAQYDGHIADLMAAGATESEARAAAADIVTKNIPNLNTRRLGMSAAQAEAWRAPFTSISFIRQPAALLAEAGTAFVKMGANQPLTLKERLAAKTVGRMAITATSLAASTAAADALLRGKDPVQAALDSINPTSGGFMSVYLPGTGARVALGGPFRAIIRAMAPGKVAIDGGGSVILPFAGIPNFVANRIQPTVRTVLDEVRNKDFYGNPIHSGAFPVNVLQGLGYALEGTMPLGATAAVNTATSLAGMPLPGQQRGQSLMDNITNTVGQFMGVNAQPPSATERLNQVTPGGDFYGAAPAVKEQVKAQHPDLWQAAVDAGPSPRRDAEVQRVRLKQQQETSDQQLLAGAITPVEWKKQRGDRMAEQRARLAQIYGDRPLTAGDVATGDPMKKYLYAIQQATDAKTGAVNFDAVDQQRAQFTPTENAYIDANAGASDTALSKMYRRTTADYYALPKYQGYTGAQASQIDALVAEAKSRAGGNDQAKALRALRTSNPDADPDVLAGARRAILGTLTQTTERKAYLRHNPDAAFLLGAAVDNTRAVTALQARLAG